MLAVEQGSGDNQRLVTDEPVEFENNHRLKLETSKELLIVLKETIDYTSSTK